jgi:hypothetical protein
MNKELAQTIFETFYTEHAKGCQIIDWKYSVAYGLTLKVQQDSAIVVFSIDISCDGLAKNGEKGNFELYSDYENRNW